MSSLVDGEAALTEVAAVCSGWKDDESARRAWHTYQLIGDALRSDELATSPSRDCDFLNKLRDRLANEPVVLAPHAGTQVQLEVAEDEFGLAPMVAAGGQRMGRQASARRWRVPITVAASVLAVSGVLMVARVSGLMPGDLPGGNGAGSGVMAQGSGRATLAQAPQAFVTAPSNLQAVSSESSPTLVQPVVQTQAGDLYSTQPQTVRANGKVVRDARLDQYLAAHKEFGGATALGVPSSFLRGATTESRDR